jgi:hypothetical protein
MHKIRVNRRYAEALTRAVVMAACFISDIVITRRTRSLKRHNRAEQAHDWPPRVLLVRLSNDNATSIILYCIKVAAGDVSSEGRGQIMKKVHGYVIESEAVHKIKWKYTARCLATL